MPEDRAARAVALAAGALPAPRETLERLEAAARREVVALPEAAAL
jgi:hypothetical protein